MRKCSILENTDESENANRFGVSRKTSLPSTFPSRLTQLKSPQGPFVSSQYQIQTLHKGMADHRLNFHFHWNIWDLS